MNSLLEKEGMAGKVQMIYIDPPYGIKYASNFQPFVNKKEVRDGRDEDLTQVPETLKAFRDTWELGIHSYLTYVRKTVALARELLNESGSIFVQISDENIHHVREIMDETLGSENFCGIITFIKTSSFSDKLLSRVCDYLLWYAKNRNQVKYRQLFQAKELGTEGTTQYVWVETPDGNLRRMDPTEMAYPSRIPSGCKILAIGDLSSQGRSETTSVPYEFKGKVFVPGQNRHWTTGRAGIDRLVAANRLTAIGSSLMYKRYLDDFPVSPITNVWRDTVMTGFTEPKLFVVQTSVKVIERCILMTTDPGDLVLDPTCGSGTSAYCAERWGRRWVTCDTSRVALALARQRLVTAVFDYYELAHPNEGISGGLKYTEVNHITLRSIANANPSDKETLFDKPITDRSKRRVTGPFTAEAVPSQRVRSFEDVKFSQEADISISRSEETLRLNDWISEMLSAGIRGKNGQVLEFARIEPLGGTKWIHAEAETKDGRKAVISFGPEYAPLEQRQVELAIDEAQQLVPKPRLVIFASFQFDPEAAKDIDELKWPGVDALKAQMNTDLLTEDLKKKRASNESFWLMGQPDVELKKQGAKYVVVVNGFDYYNTKTGGIESGDTSKIAMWELDTDYDGRSLYPRQVFFPMAGADEGWSKLAKNLKAHIDEELIENYRGNISLPFKLGSNKQIAVKIIDDRGVESSKIIKVRE
jgi:adenine-specific DNA-methyltransferase